MKYLILIVSYFTLFTAIAQQQKSTTIYFETNQWQLTEKQKKTLDSLAVYFKGKNIATLAIVGHTDNVGDSLYNIALSKKRSSSVDNYFRLKIPIFQTEVTYHGENVPAGTNVNSQARLLNRRVEIIWSEDAAGSIKSLKELYSLIAPQPQKFCINNSRDTVLVGEEGTIIYVPANTFNNSESSTGCIEITLKERYKKSLIIRDNLTTITFDNKILISQAMVEINSNVPLSPEKYLITFAPTDTIINGLKPFYGQRDSDDIMHWLESNDQLSNISGSLLNSFFRQDCGRDTTVTIYDTLDIKCPFFFCKILDWTRIRRFTPQIDTVYQKITIPCPFPAQLNLFMPDTTSWEQMKNIPLENLQYYVFNTNRLGWRNLDWLMKIQNKTDYKVHLPPDENIAIKLIFKEYRSVIPLLPAENYYHFDGAPVGYSAWLLAFKVENGKVFLGLQDVNIDEKGVSNFNFEEVTLEELYDKLKVFDKW